MARASRGGGDPVAEVRSDVRSGQLKPVYILTGQESYLARQAFDALWKAGIGDGPRGFNEQVFHGNTKAASAEAIASACMHLPMMADRRTVAVRAVNRLSADEQNALAAYCASPSPSTVLLLITDSDQKKKLDGRKKLVKAVKKNGRYCEFKRLWGNNLQDWIVAEAARREKRLDPQAGRLLETLLGNDLGQLSNCLDNAALFVGEEPRISGQAMEQVLSGRKQDALWELLDAVGERSLRGAVKNLQILFSQGEEPLPVVFLLSRRIDELSKARAAVEAGMGPEEALKAAGVAHNIAWKRKPQLQAWHGDELRRAGARLLEAESDLKGGRRIDRRWALEQAVLAIIRR